MCTSETKTLGECTGEGEREARLLIASVRRRATSLPWGLVLERCERTEKESPCQLVGRPTAKTLGTGDGGCYGTGAKGPLNYTEIPAGCIKIDIVYPVIPMETVFYGGSQEWYEVNGVKNGLQASKLKLIEPGNLQSTEGAAGELIMGGETKFVGAAALQLIQASDPPH